MMAIAERETTSIEVGVGASDRVTKITDALNQITTFTYDPNGNLLSVTDAKHQTGKVSSNLRKVEGWKLDRDHWLPNPWVNAVQPNGPWDYKSRTPDLKYENFGNYNAGLTGAALGLDPMTIQGGAGIASAIHNKSGFELKNGLTWFDTPEGNYWVLEGIKDFSDGFWDEKCKPKQPSTSKSAQ